MKSKKVSVTPRRRRLIIGVLATLVIVAISATSCQLKRVCTNTSQYHTSGDTTCLIQTKTIETYTLKKDATLVQ